MAKKSVLFVCLGNICRSPIAEGILKKKISERRLDRELEADSCGTSNYHIGDLPDSRTRQNAEENGVLLDHRGRRITQEDLVDFDHIFVMDQSNLSAVMRLETADKNKDKIKLLREFDPEGRGLDVPDPYYGGRDGFQRVFEIVDRSIEYWLNSEYVK